MENSNLAGGTSQREGLQLLSKYRGAIMGFAALWILFYHEWQLVFYGRPLLGDLEIFLKRIGFCGVDIFLLLSGMGLTYARDKGSLAGFYYRRIKRVYLPFLAVGLCYLAMGNWDWATFLGNVTGKNFYVKNMYSFLWFVPAIISLYVAFPIYYGLLRSHRQPLLCLLGTLAVWLMASVYFRDTLRNDLFGFTNRIPVFAAGVYLGWLSQNRKVEFTPATWVLLGLTLCLGLYLSYVTNFEGYYLLVPVSNCCIPNLLIALSLPLLLAKLLQWLGSIPWAGRLLQGRVLAFFGSFSLEFYCIQEALGAKIIATMRPQGYSNWAINGAILLCTTVLAYIMYLLFKYFWKLVDWLTAWLKAAFTTSRQGTGINT